MSKKAMVVALRDAAKRWRDHADGLEREVERGECYRQSPESKMSRVQVLRTNADEVDEILAKRTR